MKPKAFKDHKNNMQAAESHQNHQQKDLCERL